MASKSKTITLALFLSLNLLLFSTTYAYYPTPYTATCPMDALKLGACANLLGNLVNLKIGSPPVQPCCSLINGLVDLEAAACLCTVIQANVLNLVNLNVPIALSLLVNVCGRHLPRDYQYP